MKRSTKIITAVVLATGVAGGAAAFSSRGFCHSGPGAFAHHERGYFANKAVDRITERLALDDHQLGQLNNVKETLLSFRDDMLQQRGERRDEILELLAAPQIDRQKVLEMVREHTQTVNERAPEMVNAIADFTDSLNSEQRRRIQDFIAPHFATVDGVGEEMK